MVEADKKVKNFKGKKKVKNVLEKKAKGLKLNKIDRKKFVKIQEKQEFKSKVDKAVKEQLAKINRTNTSIFSNDEDTRDSVCTESSFGSQPAKKIPKKRVSFSGNLEHTKVFDKRVHDVKAKLSSASPGKSILKSQLKKKKRTNSDSENSVPVKKQKKVKVAEEEKENKGEDNEKEQEETTKSSTEPILKKKKTIQVTKSVKEQLLAMDRKERKAFLKNLKLQKKPEGARAQQCKQLWEKIRSSKTPKTEKDESIHKLVGLVKGHAAKLIYAHDTSRVIECLVATEREGIINNLFDELTPELVRMCKNKYSKFFVKKMLKAGSKEQRELIINAFRGHATSLFRISHAAEVLEYAYNDFANAQQRFNIISEFYGKEFVLFRPDQPKSLSEIIEAEPSKKNIILGHLEETIDAIHGKETVRLSLAHKLMLDYFENADEEKKTNLLDSLKDKIPEFIHTPDGSKLAIRLIWFSPQKDRKLIVKNFKDLSVKAALEHYGHRVLYAIFDSIDDTVRVNKFVISELANEIKRLVEDEWGEKVLHYLVHPRDGRGIDRQEIAFLKQGDNNEHSKKEAKVRYAELFAALAENLYPYLAANLQSLIFEQNRAKFVVACLETTSEHDLFDRQVPRENRLECNKAIVEICAKEFIPMDPEGLHIIESPTGNFALMGILRGDKNLPDDLKLSTTIADTINKKQLGTWISCNKGCHVLLKMLQVGSLATQAVVKECINRKQLDRYTSKGAVLLRNYLDGVSA